MGLYDSVIGFCPKCNEPIEFQTKAGACTLKTYGHDKVPAHLVDDLEGEDATCEKCGAWVELRAVTIPARVEMQVCIKE